MSEHEKVQHMRDALDEAHAAVRAAHIIWREAKEVLDRANAEQQQMWRMMLALQAQEESR